MPETQTELVFRAPAGPCYDETKDKRRLTGQIRRVYLAIKEAEWVTLRELEELTGDGQASISAQLRHLRNKHGCQVDKRRRGNPTQGLFEYQLVSGPSNGLD